MPKKPQSTWIQDRQAALSLELEQTKQLRDRAAAAHDQAQLRVLELTAQLKLLQELVDDNG